MKMKEIVGTLVICLIIGIFVSTVVEEFKKDEATVTKERKEIVSKVGMISGLAIAYAADRAGDKDVAGILVIPSPIDPVPSH